jgi:iron(III) transport system substrate-binding protein
MKISFTLTFAILAALCFTNSGIGQAQTKDRAKLIEDAKKEGKVMVYVSSNASDARALEALFEKKYPFVNMEFYSSGKDALLARYMLEARTSTYLADVYQSSVFPIMNLVEKGLLAKYYSPEREGYIEALRDKEGYWHATYLNAVTMAYNSRMLKPDDVPNSYQELLQPKWRGKMGFVLSHTEWYFAMLQSMGEEKGRQYMEALSKQNIHSRIGSSLMNQLMMAGEFPLLISQYPTGVEELKKTGAPIDWVPLDPCSFTPSASPSLRRIPIPPRRGFTSTSFSPKKDKRQCVNSAASQLARTSYRTRRDSCKAASSSSSNRRRAPFTTSITPKCCAIFAEASGTALASWIFDGGHRDESLLLTSHRWTLPGAHEGESEG